MLSNRHRRARRRHWAWFVALLVTATSMVASNAAVDPIDGFNQDPHTIAGTALLPNGTWLSLTASDSGGTALIGAADSGVSQVVLECVLFAGYPLDELYHVILASGRDDQGRFVYILVLDPGPAALWNEPDWAWVKVHDIAFGDEGDEDCGVPWNTREAPVVGDFRTVIESGHQHPPPSGSS